MNKFIVNGKQVILKTSTVSKSKARDIAGLLPRSTKVIGLISINLDEYALIQNKGGWFNLALNGKWFSFAEYFPAYKESCKEKRK